MLFCDLVLFNFWSHHWDLSIREHTNYLILRVKFSSTEQVCQTSEILPTGTGEWGVLCRMLSCQNTRQHFSVFHHSFFPFIAPTQLLFSFLLIPNSRQNHTALSLLRIEGSFRSIHNLKPSLHSFFPIVINLLYLYNFFFQSKDRSLKSQKKSWTTSLKTEDIFLSNLS